MMYQQKDKPFGMFFGKNNQRYTTIRGKHLSNFMQKACRLAYPDPNHYLRQRINKLTSHSMRVFAAVILKQMGVSDEDIAFRLRWNSDAVKLYTRDCQRTIDDLTGKAFAGAFADVERDS